LPDGFPWGSATVVNTNPYSNPPNTGVIRPYNFTITRGTYNPDGVTKSGLFVNGQYPAPMIEANWGDTFHITVNNQITGPEEGTAIHWHGLLHKDSQWMDGVPSVSQCPVAPGTSFTYTFQADLYGTSWYHAHYSEQYADGLAGPMIIYGPQSANFDIDLGPVLLASPEEPWLDDADLVQGDHYHQTYYEIAEQINGPNFVLPYSDNNLISGRMYACSTPRSLCATPPPNKVQAVQLFSDYQRPSVHLGRFHVRISLPAGKDSSAPTD
jgi:hypothetical protein